MLLNIATSEPKPKPAASKKEKKRNKFKKSEAAHSNANVNKKKTGSKGSDHNKRHASNDRRPPKTKDAEGKAKLRRGDADKRKGKLGKAAAASTAPKRNIKTVKAGMKNKTGAAVAATGATVAAATGGGEEVDFLQQLASMSKQIDSELEPLVAAAAAQNGHTDEEPAVEPSKPSTADQQSPTSSRKVDADEALQGGHTSEENDDKVTAPQSSTKRQKNVAAKSAKSAAANLAASREFGSRKHPRKQDALSRKEYKPRAKVPFQADMEAAQSSTHIFSESKFRQLGLCPELVDVIEHEDRFGLSAPTHVQRLAVPAILNGKDVIVKSETGSGKTLSFLLPVVELLLRMRPNVSRSDGTYCIIIAPTRELALQIFQSLQQLIVQGSFYWLVAGQLAGGEKKKSEKARLRKGLNFLVATPGRLLDHLQTTQTWKVSVLRWLILDEVDRLLDMGFGPQIAAILEEFRIRGVPRDQYRTIVTSATVTNKVEELTRLALRDPTFVDADEANKDAPADDEGPGAAAAGDADGNTAAFSTPKQLRQYFVEVACRDRLTSLIGFIRRQQNRDAGGVKMVVFFSTCDSVDFHTKALRHLFSQMTKNSQKTNTAMGELDFLRLHGNISQVERKSVLEQFTSTSKSRRQKERRKQLKNGESVDDGAPAPGAWQGGRSLVLLCTDVAARGLNLPEVDWIVQFDPPSETREYVHRVGRTARSGGRGQALLFLLSSELAYLKHLEAQGLHLKAHGDPSPRVKIAVWLQQQVVKLVEEDKETLALACAAYQAHSRAYAAHSKETRKFFNVRELHLGHLAQSFGLKKKPSELAQLLKSQAQSRKMRANNLQGGSDGGGAAASQKGHRKPQSDKKRGGFKLKPTSHNAANYKRKKSGSAGAAAKAKKEAMKKRKGGGGGGGGGGGDGSGKRARQDPALKVSEFSA